MRELLQQAASWKLDAQMEDMRRYFFRLPSFSEVEAGRRPFIIGRKGSGKTAIGEYILEDIQHNKFSTRLSFKNFPFNDLYEMSHDAYPKPSQYITLWRFIIYSSICWLLTRNEAMPFDNVAKLRSYFTDDPSLALDRNIQKWRSTGFSVNILGSGAEVTREGGTERSSLSWIERCSVLEDFVFDIIDERYYYVIFDELDEDYTSLDSGPDYQKYFDLLRCLFKAAQAICSKSSKNRKNIVPIILLQDDIYDLIKDPDKNKWSDLLYTLEWNPTWLRNLVSYRLYRSIDQSNRTPERILHEYMKESLVKSRLNGSSINLFEFMLELTHHRPRDILKLIQLCAEVALNGDHDHVTRAIISEAETVYSPYFRQELIDEITPIIPQVADAINIFPHYRKTSINSRDFDDFWNSIKDSSHNFLDSDTVLKALYYFSVVGRRSNAGLIFRYLSPHARLVLPSTIELHPALRRALFF